MNSSVPEMSKFKSSFNTGCTLAVYALYQLPSTPRVNLNALNCTRDQYFDALAAEGVNIGRDYKAARPVNNPWYKSRANSHPWNNPLCQGDPCREFPCPNADKAMEDNFILYIYESWGEEEAEMIMEAFRKVDAAFAK